MSRPMDYLPQGYPAMAPYRDTAQAELALDESMPMVERKPLDPPPLRPAEPAELVKSKMATWPPPLSDEADARIKTLEATVTDVMRRLKALEARVVDPSA
jgi:hypothetical protein